VTHFVVAAGHRLEYVRLPSAHPRAGAPAIVMLHEGLGSISLWRDFPQRVADATGCETIVYSRYGYGRSDPLLAPRRPDFMHDEARIALPELLDNLGLESPILFGHSDGASIALIHAGWIGSGGRDTGPTGRPQVESPGAPREGGPVSAVIAMAPHVLVEDISVRSIRQAKVAYENDGLRDRLARYHHDVDSAFRGWNDIWLDPAFRDWNIEEFLPSIRCPVLAIQGEDDEYGTMDQVDRIAARAPDVELVKLADCRHSPHRDQPDAVLAAVAPFVARVLDAREGA
jgi:pimeloyl-ACP methyl ester carboxylesterase